MSAAGYIQLAALGQQDVYLTGKPEVTYFSGVYKRHTPFVLEAYDIPFQDQQVLYGSNNICRIPPKGDLIRAVTLKMTLPALTNPGNNWTWPNQSLITYLPHFVADGVYYAPALLGAVSYYSTTNLATWISSGIPPLSTVVSYDSVANKFIFKNCSNVSVDSNFGVFWGFDPKLGTALGSNLVYTVSGSRTADLTLEQSGWLQLAGIVNPKKGLFLQLGPNASSGLVAGDSGIFFNFAGISGTGTPAWNNYFPSATAFRITSGGRIGIGGVGLYLARFVITTDVGSLATISYGSDLDDGVPSAPLYDYTYTCRVSPDPSMPVIVPINVINASNNYYFHITTVSGATSVLSGSWVSINPLEECYKITSSLSVTQNGRLNFYGNNSISSGTYVILATDSSFTFVNQGLYLITGMLEFSPEQYASNVSIVSSGTTLFTYDMSTQGRNPTFVFSMPLTVSSTTTSYAITVGLVGASSGTLTRNSFFAIHEFGVPPGNDPGIVLPLNGTLLTPKVSSMVVNGVMNLTSNFTSTSGSSFISVTPDGSLKFSNTGTYMMTAVMSTQNPITSVSFGTTRYNVGLGLLPPYTFTIPYNVLTPSSTANISFTSTVSTSQTVFSNTFISVYPVTSNTLTTQSFNYTDSVGTWAIQTAELKIGGQSIQTLTGEYIELWNDLNVPYENQSGLTLLTGKNDSTYVYPPGRTYYVNLPFYFYGSPELSIPICALDRQDVEVWVTFRNFSELTEIAITDPSLVATILVEYVYLSDPEINWFQTHRLDYLITQCQYQYFDLLPYFTSAIFQLELINPVRELFFVLQPVSNKNYDYSGNGLQSLALSFNGAEAFTAETTDALYLGSLQPFEHYTTYPSRNFFMFPFTTNTATGKPYGQINMSRIRQILLQVNSSSSYLAKQLRVVAINYNVLRVENGLAGVMFNSGTVSIPVV